MIQNFGNDLFIAAFTVGSDEPNQINGIINF